MLTNPKSEGDAFDKIIRERKANGWSGDLQAAIRNPYFYKNNWRFPWAVQYVIGRYVEFILRNTIPGKILDVGCGAGTIALELARAGREVVGIDVSGESIREAQRISQGIKNVYFHQTAVQDFANIAEPLYENIVYVGSLHHFKDLAELFKFIDKILLPGGRVIAIEPNREMAGNSKANAAITGMLRDCLFAAESWYEGLPKIEKAVEEIEKEYSYVEENQSPNDNVSKADAILYHLRARYGEVAFQKNPLWYVNMAGGLRGMNSEKIGRAIFRWAEYMTAMNIITPGGYLFAGEKK